MASFWEDTHTVEPRLSGPRLSEFLDYPDFFSGPNLVMSISVLAISFLKLQHWRVQSNARVFCSQRAKVALVLVVPNEEHSNEFWLAQSRVVTKWNFTLYGMENKERTFIHDRQRKQSVLFIKEKNEDADDIVFQMICKSVVSQLNVIFLIYCNQFCWVLLSINIYIFEYPDPQLSRLLIFMWSQQVRIIEVQLYKVLNFK